MGVLIILIILVLSVSFTCSMLESVMLSTTHSFIALLAKDGRRSGRILLRMKRDISNALAAILTLNTVANTAGAAAIGAQCYELFGEAWVAVSSAALTVVILVCSEYIPKTIGAAHWKRLAPPSAYILSVLVVVLYPVVKSLQAVSHVFNPHITQQQRITREELLVHTELAHTDGVLNEKEAAIVKNLLIAGELWTEDILTPRAVIFAFQKDQTVREAVEGNPTIHFTRIPVFDAGLDDVKGIAYRSELLTAYYTGRGDDTMETLVKPIHAIPESKPVTDLLDEFISRREHMFLVVDEYGGTAGIVTLEDVVETILGVEIVDEIDAIVDMRAYAIEKWRHQKRRHWT